jgi:hypothetical protein
MPFDETHISWLFFLSLLQPYCWGRGWAVEYDTPEDYRCVIFARETVSPDPLSLFDGGEVQSSTPAHFR